MAHRPRWLTFAAVGMIAAFVFIACQGAGPTGTPAGTTAPATDAPATGAPATGAPGTDAPATDAPATDAPASPGDTPGPTAYPDPVAQASDPSTITDSYPNYGDGVDCDAGTFNGLPYTGTIESITAPDPDTVVFTLCAPDVAFLSKVAFSVFAINDSDFLLEHAAAGDIKNIMNGTGPYVLDEWRRGEEILYSRFDGYWGEPAAVANGVLRWAATGQDRLDELLAGTGHGMTLVANDAFDTVRNDPNLQLLEGSGLNTLYLGFNHDLQPWSNPLVRQALAVGIDRQRIVDNFMPPGSEVASHFTPGEIPFGETGDAWPDFDPDRARDLLAQAGFEDGFDTTLAWRNPPIRGYLPQPDETAADVQAQLADLGIRVTLDKQESGTFIGNSNTGKLTGLFLLGWGADYPDATNFLDYHFGSGCTSAFGACYPEIFGPLRTGGTSADEAVRTQAYTDANNAIREQVPMVPISHAGFANAYLAGVEGAQVSPLSNELLYRMAPPDGDQIVFYQNAEPIGLYCADETDGESLRACEQSMESLYSFEINGTATIPTLAEECTASDDLSVWTCNLRDGVTFHNGATFEAKDVIVSFAAQWDALSALHVGNTGVFEYWGGLWGGNLNPVAPCGIPGQPACAQ